MNIIQMLSSLSLWGIIFICFVASIWMILCFRLAEWGEQRAGDRETWTLVGFLIPTLLFFIYWYWIG